MTVEEFYKLRDTEDYFKFFGIEFDQSLINVKRFHMMKEYGTLIRKGIDSIVEESKLLEFLKFSLSSYLFFSLFVLPVFSVFSVLSVVSLFSLLSLLSLLS